MAKIYSFPHGEILEGAEPQQQHEPTLAEYQAGYNAMRGFLQATVDFIRANPTVPATRIMEGIENFLTPGEEPRDS